MNNAIFAYRLLHNNHGNGLRAFQCHRFSYSDSSFDSEFGSGGSSFSHAKRTRPTFTMLVPEQRSGTSRVVCQAG